MSTVAVHDSLSMLVLDYGRERFAMSAAALHVVDSPTEIDCVDVEVSLGVDIPADGQSRIFDVDTGRATVSLRTHTKMSLHEIGRDRFFRLPKIVQRAGCAQWVRGIIVPDEDKADEPMMLWLDIVGLAVGVCRPKARNSTEAKAAC